MTGVVYVINKLGETCAYLEQLVAERDAQIAQLIERITRLETER